MSSIVCFCMHLGSFTIGHFAADIDNVARIQIQFVRLQGNVCVFGNDLWTIPLLVQFLFGIIGGNGFGGL